MEDIVLLTFIRNRNIIKEAIDLLYYVDFVNKRQSWLYSVHFHDKMQVY